MVDVSTKNQVLVELEEWRRRGNELRARLLEDRRILVERLKEIETALAQIPREPSGQPIMVSFPLAEEARNLSAPDIVRAVLAQHGGPLGAAEIIETAQKIRPGIDPVLVHSAIHRLVRGRRLMPIGKRGKRRYRLQLQTEMMNAMSLTGVLSVAQDGPTETGHPRKGKIAPDSILGRAIEILRLAGTPLHVKQIMEKMSSRGRKVNFTSLVGALARLSKERRIICRDKKPNTFGLIEWNQTISITPPPMEGSITTMPIH